MCPKPDPADRPPTDLSALLAAELRVEAALEQARREAGAILAAARADSDRARASLDLRRSDGERIIDADVAATTAARLAAHEREASEELSLYQALRGPRREELAAAMAELLAAIVRGERTP